MKFPDAVQVLYYMPETPKPGFLLCSLTRFLTMSASSDTQRSGQKRPATGTNSPLRDTHLRTRSRASQSSMSAVKAPPPPPQKQPSVSAAVRTLTSDNGIQQPPASAVFGQDPLRQRLLKQSPLPATAKAAKTEYALNRSTATGKRTPPTVKESIVMQTAVSVAARVPPPLKRLKPASVPSLAATLSPKQQSKRSSALAEAKAPRPQKSRPSEASKAPTPEKRLKRYRPVPTIAIRERIHRAQSQQFFLVQRSDTMDGTTGCDFVVLGSTGNVYTVRITQIPTCSCPDHAKGNLCKHILFVMLKVIGLDPESPLVYQAALLQSELQELFALLASRRVGKAVMANDKVKKSYASLSMTGIDDSVVDVGHKSLADDSDCPICFDALVESSESLSYCRAACGTHFHADCINRWLRGQAQGKATCPNCRQPWDAGANKSRISSEGYANLGALQGLSSERDTSSYFRDGYES